MKGQTSYRIKFVSLTLEQSAKFKSTLLPVKSNSNLVQTDSR